MTNTKNLANLAAALDDGTSGQVLQSTGSGGVAFADSTGGGVTTYANKTAIDAVSSPSEGDLAFDEDKNVLYIRAGSAWERVQHGSNVGPRFTTTPASSLSLSASGSTSTITAAAVDETGFPVTYDWDGFSGSTVYNSSSLPNQITSVSESNGVFTLTPSTNSSHGGSFTFRTKASDGAQVSLATTAVSLLFSWSNGTQQAKIQASDAAASDFFGQSVSISDDGNTAIIGAYGEDTTATDAGSAYIFTRSGTTWSQQAKIQASDAEASDAFSYGWGDGVCISGDGDTVIVGAYFEDTTDTSAGAAYIFTRSGTSWSQEAKIQASDAEASDQFGKSVSISDDGNTVLVGAWQEDTGGSNAGAAYIFTRSGTTWSEEAKIQASDKAGGDDFGWSVSISDDGNTALVGSWGDGSSAGAAYIFTRSGTTWSQEAKLVADDGSVGDRFGRTVCISGDGNTALIGASWQSSYTGAAYIFTRSGTTWSQEAKLQSDDIAAGDYFSEGLSISDDGDTVVIGAWQESAGGTGAGAAYVFSRSGTTWSQDKKFQSSDIAADDKFGWSVSMSGDANSILVGAYHEDTTASNAGSAYIFVR